MTSDSRVLGVDGLGVDEGGELATLVAVLSGGTLPTVTGVFDFGCCCCHHKRACMHRRRLVDVRWPPVGVGWE